MDLVSQFEAAQVRVKQLPRTPTPPELLELYSFFKQATAGDVQGERPGILDFKGRVKFDAWTSRQGQTRDQAMTAYVSLVKQLEERYSR